MSALTQVGNVQGRVAPFLVVHLEPVLRLSDEQLYAIAQLNRDLRIERNAWGELIIMPPTGGDTGEKNAEITMQLRWWAKQDKTGATFDSSTGFRLPNGAIRSPDAAWVSDERLNTLTTEQRRGFMPLCPDFVIELGSPSDIAIRLELWNFPALRSEPPRPLTGPPLLAQGGEKAMYRAGVIPSLDKEGWRVAPGWFECGDSTSQIGAL